LSEEDLVQLKQDGLPSSSLELSALDGQTMTGLFSECGLALSGREVKDALLRNALFINGVAKCYEDNMKVARCFSLDSALFGRFFIVKLGKKKYHLFELSI
jgi:tyrosyl-tRNA synthetase